MWAGLQVYVQRRVALLLVLGFSSGLPLALTSSTLQAWATVEGVSLQNLGFLTLIGSAYTLKFLWAPLVDRFVPPLLGRRRGWIILTQLLLAVCIAAMGFFTPAANMLWLAALAVLVTFLSATQDIAFDAYSTDVLHKKERAAGAALKVLGYRLAMVLSGGGALILADQWLGWRTTYVLMGGIMAACALATLAAPEPQTAVRPPASLAAAVILPLKEFFRRRGAVTVLLLIVLYKLGDAFAGAISTPFLLRGAGFSLSEVGAINKVFGLSATIAGALLGGGLMARLGLYRALLWFGVLQAVSNFGYWLLAISTPYLSFMAAVVAVENLCGGLGTAAFVALLMALCRQEFSATQFALLSALSAIGRTYLAGPLSPSLAQDLGWPSFFALTVLIALPGLVLLWWHRKEILALESGR